MHSQQHLTEFCTGAVGADDAHLAVCEAPQHSAGMSDWSGANITYIVHKIQHRSMRAVRALHPLVL